MALDFPLRSGSSSDSLEAVYAANIREDPVLILLLHSIPSLPSAAGQTDRKPSRRKQLDATTHD